MSLERAVNQRCTCVIKRKKKRTQVRVMKEYWQVPAAVELDGYRKVRVMESLQTDGCGPQWPPVEQPQPRCGRSAKWILEDNTACYGQDKKLGQYSSLSLSPHTETSTLSRIKCERYIFLKTSVFVCSLNFVNFVWLCFCLYLYVGLRQKYDHIKKKVYA